MYKKRFPFSVRLDNFGVPFFTFQMLGRTAHLEDQQSLFRGVASTLREGNIMSPFYSYFMSFPQGTTV